MMPLDSTQVPLDGERREAIFAHGSPLTDQLTLLYHQWMAGTPLHSPTPTLFDPGGGDIYVSAGFVPGKAHAY